MDDDGDGVRAGDVVRYRTFIRDTSGVRDEWRAAKPDLVRRDRSTGRVKLVVAVCRTDRTCRSVHVGRVLTTGRQPFDVKRHDRRATAGPHHLRVPSDGTAGSGRERRE